MTFRFGPADEGDDLGPPPGPFQFRPRRRWRIPGGIYRWVAVAVALIVLFLIASIIKGIYADWLWFGSVESAGGTDYQSVFRLRIVTRIWLFFAGAGLFLGFFVANILLALRGASTGGDRSSFELAGLDLGPARRVLLVAGVAAAIFLAVIFGTQAAGQWDSILLLINSQSFGADDPAFGTDIGFYVFRLPALNFILGWSLAMVILTTVVVAAIYGVRMLLSGFGGSAPVLARPHVSLLIVAVLGLFVWRYWLGRFSLVYSDRGAAFGAGFTDINAQLPMIYVLMGFGALTAVCVLINAFRRGLVLLPVAASLLWVVAAIAGGLIYPATVQRFQVEPNELAKEREFIQRNIDATRAAYGLDPVFGAAGIEEQEFPANAFVTASEIEGNPETIDNIRLWDTRPLLQTLNQIQTIRPLYQFIDVDIDRYVVDGVLRQVALSARELDPNRLPEDARSWVNERLQFTHGFGLAMVPVNEVVEEGLPEFFVQDIPPAGELDIEQPRIYYGELDDRYVIVNSTEEEFDFPVGEERATNVFDGGGGVKLDSFLRRAAYAWEFADTNILISDAITDDSRVLYRRNIRERVHEIAPFLRLDDDPYLVVADGELFWLQDAYTATDLYPYSTRTEGINYIRNSVKVVVSAYDGETTFYLVEPDDPIAQTYRSIYPDLFTPFEDMPDSLRAHIRYPEDLFGVQAQVYRRYHIQDPAVFFNREDVWDIPTELFVDREQPVEPYYVIMRLPGEPDAEFALILPFRPANRNNTIAWLAGRSDGEEFGRLLAFRFPTDALVFGPSQIESRIDQDTVISQQISLWNQSGSQVIRGNLLMIPIGDGNLFVEPIYLQATASSLPELKRVVVVNGRNIAMEPTLEQSLAVVLGLAEATGPTLEDVPTPLPTGDATPPADETPPAVDTPVPTLEPTPSPTDAGPTAPLPDDVAALIAEANEVFERADQLLRDGDFAGYGEEIDRLSQILQRLAELTGLEGG